MSHFTVAVDIFALDKYINLTPLYLTPLCLDRFGVRNAFMKNRKSVPLEGFPQILSQIMRSFTTVIEEPMMRDHSNASRSCTLSSHYVGLMDLELEEEDKEKEFLYMTAKRDALKWIKNHASEIQNIGQNSKLPKAT